MLFPSNLKVAVPVRVSVWAVPPVWVKRGETVQEAFKQMHENKLPGLPIVDKRYQVIGYVNLLELLSLSIKVKIGAESPKVKK